MKRTIIFGVLASLMGLVSSAQASEQLLGKNWVTGDMTYLDYPSSFDPISTGYAMSATGNWNVKKQLDVQGQLSHSWADDSGIKIKTTMLQGEAVYFFHPRNRIKPFVRGGLAAVRTSIDAGALNADDDNLGFLAGGGAEFTMGDKTVMQLQAKYFDINSDTSTAMDARAAYAFGPKLLGNVALNYNFDSEITMFSLGVTYRLQPMRRR